MGRPYARLVGRLRVMAAAGADGGPSFEPVDRTTSLRRLTRTAGVLYLAVFILSPLTDVMRSILVVPGDATATTANVQAGGPFVWGMAGTATVALLEVGLAAALFVLFRPVSRPVSLTALLARVAGSVLGVTSYLAAGLLLAIVEEAPGESLALSFLGADVVAVRGLLLALSMILTGWLAYRSGFISELPGMLLVVAGLGHFAQNLTIVIASGLTNGMATVLLLLAVPAELTFVLWLLIVGVDAERWRACARGAGLSRP